MNNICLKKLTFIYPVVLLVSMTTLHAEEDSERIKRSVQTAGLGCEVIRSALYREPISGTNLNTGIFYILRELKGNENVRSHLASGFITWTGQRHVQNGKARYVFSDMHHNMELYTEGATWYTDSQWAFLESKTEGWYHLINCGFPNLHATWSNWEEEDDHSGAYPMMLDPYYPGNHSKEDFLFKPVHLKDHGENVFHIICKSFEGGGMVSVSDETYAGASNYLQVESEDIWSERVKGKEDEKNAMFIIEKSRFEEDDDEYVVTLKSGNNGSMYSYTKRTIFALMLVFMAWMTVILVWFKRSVVIQYIMRNDTDKDFIVTSTSMK